MLQSLSRGIVRHHHHGRNSSSVWSRNYVSRAHPQPATLIPIPEALVTMMEGIKGRMVKRAKRWEERSDHRLKKGTILDNEGVYRNQDETVEMALNLNLDPKKPGQALRGSMSLPHGTGKKGISCVVFTEDAQLAQQAKELGALDAGGEELINRIVDGTVSVDSFERCLASPGIMPIVSKKGARLLGPRGLMPNVKTGTVIQHGKDLIDLLQTTLMGKDVQYRTSKDGILHLPIGKGSFGNDKLLQNIAAIMNTVYTIKPENITGKGKKGKSKKQKKKGQTSSSRNEKYILSAFLSSTMGKGIKIDLKTLDPSSPFYLQNMES